MEIILSNMDGTPIYEQIVRQIKAKIVGGELTAGEALPSMRLLAKELRISVITTKRAYEELEREGFIITQTGRGSFVAPCNTELLREEQLRVVEGVFLGLPGVVGGGNDLAVLCNDGSHRHLAQRRGLFGFGQGCTHQFVIGHPSPLSARHPASTMQLLRQWSPMPGQSRPVCSTAQPNTSPMAKA